MVANPERLICARSGQDPRGGSSGKLSRPVGGGGGEEREAISGQVSGNDQKIE